MTRTAAFFSYTRRDDRLSDGLLSKTRALLESQIAARLGEDIEVFQDTDDIIGGDDWRDRIDAALAEATVFVAVITPSFFNSDPCRTELERFLSRDRSGTILPVVFLDTPALRDEARRANDSLIDTVERTQWIDWTGHDHKTDIDGDLRVAVIDLAKVIVARLSTPEPLANPDAETEVEVEPVAITLGERLDGLSRKMRASTPTLIGKVHETLDQNRRMRELTDAAIPGAVPEPLSIFRDPLTIGGEGPEMIVIPAGEFLMGSSADEDNGRANERPQHSVRIARPFAMGRMTVTFAEYDLFCEETGRQRAHDWSWGRGDRPVIGVTWHDAMDYCGWLSKETGTSYRLPSEAEWEYACRAGTTTPFWFGDLSSTDRANVNAFGEPGLLGNWLGLVAGDVGETPSGAYRQQTVSVRDLDADNPWGLRHMHGNVWEWTLDPWTSDYIGAPDDGTARRDENADRPKADGVMRGGSWLDGPVKARSAYRGRSRRSGGSGDDGFRVVRDL